MKKCNTNCLGCPLGQLSQQENTNIKMHRQCYQYNTENFVATTGFDTYGNICIYIHDKNHSFDILDCTSVLNENPRSLEYYHSACGCFDLSESEKAYKYMEIFEKDYQL